jgi:hypothetical protein
MIGMSSEQLVEELNSGKGYLNYHYRRGVEKK